MSETEELIQVSDLAKSFDAVQAINGISFHVSRGEVFVERSIENEDAAANILSTRNPRGSLPRCFPRFGLTPAVRFFLQARNCQWARS